MGCCSTKQSVGTKRTIREANSDLQLNEAKGEQTYVGKKAKELLDEAEIDDLMLAVKNN